MDNCIFCKIAKKEIPADIVYEDENFIAFLDLSPATIGHTLVVPKEHSRDLIHMNDKDSDGFMTAIKKVAKAVQKSVGADGFNLELNNGECAGQFVFHTHIHIIPRSKNDGVHNRYNKVAKPSDGDFKKLAESIKAKL